MSTCCISSCVCTTVSVMQMKSTLWSAGVSIGQEHLPIRSYNSAQVLRELTRITTDFVCYIVCTPEIIVVFSSLMTCQKYIYIPSAPPSNHIALFSLVTWPRTSHPQLMTSNRYQYLRPEHHHQPHTQVDILRPCVNIFKSIFNAVLQVSCLNQPLRPYEHDARWPFQSNVKDKYRQRLGCTITHTCFSSHKDAAPNPFHRVMRNARRVPAVQRVTHEDPRAHNRCSVQSPKHTNT